MCRWARIGRLTIRWYWRIRTCSLTTRGMGCSGTRRSRWLTTWSRRRLCRARSGRCAAPNPHSCGRTSRMVGRPQVQPSDNHPRRTLMSNKRKASSVAAMRDPAEVPKDQAVTIAYVVGDSVTYSWHRSLVELIAYDSANRHRVMRGGFIAMHYGTGGLIEARNKGVKTFLEEDNADWLFWVDTDMGFAPDTIDLLMDAADPVERPMVGALCFSQREDSADGFGGYRCTATPTIFDWAHIEGQYGWQVRWNYPQNTVMQVGGTGAACVLVHRSVFEKIQAEHGNV